MSVTSLPTISAHLQIRRLNRLFLLICHLILGVATAIGGEAMPFDKSGAALMCDRGHGFD